MGIGHWQFWLIFTALASMSNDAAKPHEARALRVTTAEVYGAKERLGYACWPVLWPGVEGDIYLAFAEKRRAPNPTWEPVPLDFWEAMDLPLNYHVSFCNGARDTITELVVLRNCDNGDTWVATGRSPSRVINAFAWAGLSDGRMIRARSDDYVAFKSDVPPRLSAETSADGGATWKLASVVLEGYQTYSHRLKRLRDDSLVLVEPYFAVFGPGRARVSRHTVRPYVRQQLEMTVGVFLSTDEGQSWSGPFILSSSNSIHSSCNPENFVAMIEACKEFGVYPREGRTG